MSWRSLLLLVFLQFAFDLVAQTGVVRQRSAGDPVAATLVIEGGAKATLEKDSIRVALPLSAASKPGTKVTVWLASPKDVRSGETVAILSPDRKSASAALPWPNDAQEKREEDIGWYRIGYRVDENGVEQAHGMLSIGAIASNLMELRLAYPKLVAPGHGISARVIAVNPVTGRSLSGVRPRPHNHEEEIFVPERRKVSHADCRGTASGGFRAQTQRGKPNFGRDGADLRRHS